MSFETLARRRQITIVRQIGDALLRWGGPWGEGFDGETRDEYGDEVKTPATPETVWARRHQLSATEDTSDRDEQARTFIYYLRPGVAIDGRAIIHDGDLTLRVLGEPEVVENMRGPHHIEVRAELVDA